MPPHPLPRLLLLRRLSPLLPSLLQHLHHLPPISKTHLLSPPTLPPLLHRSPPHLSRPFSGMAASSPASVHDFTVKDARGNDVDLSAYKGKVLLIVNVASQCGLTNSNYTELSQLYDKYKDQGLEILAFPSNQFGAQEPGSNEEILEFACTRFKAEYPIFEKVDVNGDAAAPIYKFLKSSKGSLFGDGIKWNFAKFLVDKQGQVVDRYAPTTSPLSIEKDIKKLLFRDLDVRIKGLRQRLWVRSSMNNRFKDVFHLQSGIMLHDSRILRKVQRP